MNISDYYVSKFGEIDYSQIAALKDEVKRETRIDIRAELEKVYKAGYETGFNLGWKMAMEKIYGK